MTRKEIALELAALRSRIAALEIAARPKPGMGTRRRLKITEVEALTSRNRMTIWRWCRAGKFPQPHYIGWRRSWFADEVEAWCAANSTSKPPENGNLKGTEP